MSLNDPYYLSQEEPNRSCLIALRDIILEQDTNISETRKYGMPCFTYQKIVFCYLWIDKFTNEPYILMTEGKYLDHPDLEKGKRSRMKILRIKPDEDFPMDKIILILNTALNLYKKGTIKINN